MQNASLGRSTCCQSQTEIAVQISCVIQSLAQSVSHNTNPYRRPISLPPGTWQGSHCSTIFFFFLSLVWLEFGQRGSIAVFPVLETVALYPGHRNDAPCRNVASQGVVQEKEKGRKRLHTCTLSLWTSKQSVLLGTLEKWGRVKASQQTPQCKTKAQ